MPMPAMAATRHQRETSLPAPCTALGSQPVLLIATSTREGDGEPGQQRRALPPAPALPRARA